MNHYVNSAILVAVAAIVTLFLRAVPFVIFSGQKEMPNALRKIADVLPTAIMSVLVIYCIKTDISNLKELILFPGTGEWSGIIATAIALLGVVGIHLWKRHTLLSIATGTVVYMVLIRVLG